MFYNERIAHFESLLLKKHTGVITKEEELELTALLKENSQLELLVDYYNRLQYQMSDKITSQDAEVRLNMLKQQVQARSIRKKKTRRSAYISIAGAAIIVVSIFFFNSINERNGQNARLKLSVTNNVVLHLAGGKEIILNQSGKQTIQIGNNLISAENKTLNLTDNQSGGEEMNTLEVPRKLDYKVELPDGSTVHLNASSKLKFPFKFTGEKREIYIEGEAYLEISKKPEQLFVVHTPEGDLKVLGTAFNVNTYTSGILKTAIVNGSVEVDRNNKKRVINKGDYLVWDKMECAVTDYDSKSVLSWMDGIYYFHNSTLSEIAAILTRNFDLQVTIDDPSLYNIPFTGSLNRSESLETFLRAIAYSSDIRYEKNGDILHFHK